MSPRIALMQEGAQVRKCILGMVVVQVAFATQVKIRFACVRGRKHVGAPGSLCPVTAGKIASGELGVQGGIKRNV